MSDPVMTWVGPIGVFVAIAIVCMVWAATSGRLK